jgi:tetratricopeptide (TPR) repeat protein
MNWKILVILAVVLIAVALAIFFWPHPQDCSFSARKRSVGVDLDVAVGDLHAIKGKVGLSDDQVRDFDVLMKDFALKYDAACEDLRQGRMNQAEYSCRRKNMDDTLDKIRFFLEKVEAAKTLADPAAQRDVIIKALASLEEATKTGYDGNCTSAMSVTPLKLLFEDHASEHSLQISNSGNNAMNFTVKGLPRGFVPQPQSGDIPVGHTISVAIFRTYEPITDPQPITFHMSNNFLDDIPIQITLDSQNSALFDDLANQVQSAATAKNRTPTVEDALQVVDDSLHKSAIPPTQNIDAMRYFLAAGVLSRAGQSSAAHQALDTATAKNPALTKEPSVMILRGIVVNREGKTDEALQHFEEANQRTSGTPSEKDTKALTNLLSGAAVYKADKNRANDLLSKPEVQATVSRNPHVLAFASKEMDVKNLNSAVAKAGAQSPVPR